MNDRQMTLFDVVAKLSETSLAERHKAVERLLASEAFTVEERETLLLLVVAPGVYSAEGTE